MKKTPISRIIVSLVLTIPSIIGFVRLFSGEDNRICSDGQRVKHGNPTAEKPTTPCNLLNQKQKSENTNPVLTANQQTMVNQNFTISMERPNNGMISKQYTCQGEGKFPEIKLTNIPTKTKSLALIIEDPDAPTGTRTHLLLANIDFNGSESTLNNSTLKSATIGKNSRGKTERGAPCPPNGIHRYFFKVFALDSKLNLNTGFSKEELTKLIENHILEKKELIGLYKKQ